MDLLARDLPCPRPPCAGFVVDVLCCVGAVCVQDFRGCVQDLGALPDSPSAGQPPPTLPQPDSAGPPKIRSLFSLSRHNFHSFFLSWGSFRGILVVFEGAGPSNVHVWALGLSCESQNVKNNFTIDLPLP